MTLARLLALILFASVWMSHPAHGGDHDNDAELISNWDTTTDPATQTVPHFRYKLRWHNGDATPSELPSPEFDDWQLLTYQNATMVGLLDESMRGTASPLSVWWIGLPNEAARVSFQDMFWQRGKNLHYCR